MGNLIKYELRKMFGAKSFYICCAIAVGLNLLTTLLILVMGEALSIDIFYSSVSNSASSTIIIIMVSILICSEFADGITKMIVARGYSRTNIYIAKYILTVIVTCCLCLICWLIGLITGIAICGPGTGWGPQVLLVMIAQFLLLLVSASMTFFLSMCLRKLGGVIAIGIFAPNIISTILMLADMFISSELHSEISLNDYWFSQFMFQISSSQDATTNACLKVIGMSLVYVAAFFAAGYFINRKRDV